MSKKSHNLFRSSDSYVNLFRPYLRDSTIYLDRTQLPRPATKKRRAIVPQATCSKSSSCSSVSKHASSDSLRALSLDMLPIWRYSSNAGKPLQEASEHMDLFKSKAITCKAMQTKFHKFHHRHHSPTLRKERSTMYIPDLVEPEESKLHPNLPIFEVLPPLRDDSKKNLLYENEYLLDGIRYDLHTCSRSKGYGRLSLDYIKYLKSISSKTKPTDQDVIFGNARVLHTNGRGWGNSRINWLLDMERRQELRKKQKQQKNLPSERSDSFVDLCCFPFPRNLLVWNFD